MTATAFQLRHDRVSALAELSRALERAPERPLLRWHGGAWTVREFATAADRRARGLAALGVQAGDRVAIMSGNSAQMLALQYGVYMCGAVEVAVNAELRGPMLDHVLGDADPAVVLVEPDLLAQTGSATGVRIVALDAGFEAGCEAAPAIEHAEPDPSDLAAILYTSGTTGPAKGVMLPHGYLANLGALLAATQELGEDDVAYLFLPFFHVDAHIALPACLMSGAALAFRRRFSVREFWSDCERFGATWFAAVGSMLSMLAKTEPPPGAPLQLRRAMAAPIPAEAYELFEDRLGIQLYEIYGQTEADAPCYGTRERRRRGSAGWACTGFEVAIADPDDGRILAAGEAGEIVYRPPAPWMMSLGYWRRPHATVTAWRDLWFHSGDLGRLDEDGFLWFSGRLGDRLRRRGENIAAFELEQTLRAAPGIADCAAVALPDPHGGEDEIKVFVVLDARERFDSARFFAFCERNLPRFALPRYVEVLPPEHVVRGAGTGALQKHLLPRELGAATIDRLGVEA